MSFTYEINSDNQIKVHFASITNFHQDDGFGEIINTFNMCKNDNNISNFVHDFMYDNFNFVD